MRAEAQKPPPQPPPRRLTVGSIGKGKKEQPVRVLVYGSGGVGKTTFGVNAPNSVFIAAESGLVNYPDHPRFKPPEDGMRWSDIIDAVRELETEPHDFKTLVIDSLDWAEPLCWRHLCELDGVSSIEKVSGGYGKGYNAAVDEWRLLLAALERMSEKRGMHVILLAHAQVKKFANPAGEDFDRYLIKLHEKSAGPIMEWCDAVLLAAHDFGVRKDERTKKFKGVTTQARVLRTTWDAAWEAKNRYNLPEELPLSWDDFIAAVRAGDVAAPDALRDEIQRKAQQCGGEVEKKALDAMRQAGNDTRRLAEINNKLNANLAQKEKTNG
jgi:hypothetical protein